MADWTDTKKVDLKEIHDVLDKILPHNKKISEAPEAPIFLSEESELKWKTNERESRYKSCDAYGNIYLIQNPQAWETNKHTGAKIRNAPQKVYTWHQAKYEAEASPTLGGGMTMPSRASGRF